MISASRENNFDAVRLSLALLVIYSHSFPLGTGSQNGEPLAVFTRGQLTFGGFAVNCFFVISGYLITQSWERTTSLSKYMRKRIARIYPGYVVATALCSWVILTNAGPVGRATFSWDYLLDFLKNVPLLREPRWPRVFVDNPYPLAVNGSTWTIRYEFLCYIGLATMGLVGVLAQRRLVLFSFVLSLVVQCVYELTAPHLGNVAVMEVITNLLRFAPLYLAGVTYYLYREVLPRDGRLSLLALLGLVAAAWLPPGFSVAFPIFGTYLLFQLAYSRKIRLYRVAKYGDFSYGTYLYAFPIQQMVMYWYGSAIAPLKLFALAAPLSVLVGVLSWYLVERPFMRPRNKRTSHQGVKFAAADSARLQTPEIK